MNHYSQLLNYIKELGEDDFFVNTITQGDFNDIDLDKGQLHPLLHIQVNSGNFTTEQTILFNIQIGCFDLREINKEIVEDRFWKQDNEVDNLNEIFMPGTMIGVSDKDYDFFVFDRWGEVIYEGHDLEDGWDGYFKGEICKTDTYVWKIKLKGIDGVQRDYVGHVNLLR